MIDGRNPYQIISHWKNPRTSRLHIFKSDNLWVDPTDSIKEEKRRLWYLYDNEKK